MTEPSWLEISLIVEPELTDPVAELLSRYVPGGVVIESTSVTVDEHNLEGREVGPLRVAAYLPMDNHVEETRQKIEESLWYLGRIRPLPPAQYSSVNEIDWAEAWKEHYRPIPIGDKLVIMPAWLGGESPGRIPVRMDPGMAFGTGTHPTTQLCLAFIEELLNLNAGEQSAIDVIDIGCGSGILSVAAIKLGAKRALAVDIDPLAVGVTRENAVINHVEDQIEISEGSLDEVLEGRFTFKKADLVLANILAPVLIDMLEKGLGSVLAPDGSLVLSGIIDDQEVEVRQVVERSGLQIVNKKQIDDWVALHAIVLV